MANTPPQTPLSRVHVNQLELDSSGQAQAVLFVVEYSLDSTAGALAAPCPRVALFGDPFVRTFGRFDPVLKFTIRLRKQPGPDFTSAAKLKVSPARELWLLH